MYVLSKTYCLLQERVSDRLEGQRQEQAIQHYQTQADELEQWLARTRSTVSAILEPKVLGEADAEDQLAECEVSAPPAVHSRQFS